MKKLKGSTGIIFFLKSSAHNTKPEKEATVNHKPESRTKQGERRGPTIWVMIISVENLNSIISKQSCMTGSKNWTTWYKR